MSLVAAKLTEVPKLSKWRRKCIVIYYCLIQFADFGETNYSRVIADFYLHKVIWGKHLLTTNTMILLFLIKFYLALCLETQF